MTIVKSSSGTTLVPVESRLLAARKLFLEGEITSSSACAFIRELMFLLHEDRKMAIDIYINSPGGEIDAGMMIYDALKGASDAEINLHCIGMAASMAAILLASGKRGHRFILPHSRIMIHEPLIAGGIGGSASSIQKTAESIMEMKQLSVRLLAADTGRDAGEVERAIAYDHYMNAEEAIAFGICDSIETTVV